MDFFTKRAGVITGLVVSAGILVAAATGDRLNTPVKIGQGNAGTKSIIFDSGDGASNATIFSTSDTNISVGTTGAPNTFTNGTFTPNSHIENQAGTAANPSYTFSGDTDTGVYLFGANVIGFSINGSRGMALSVGGVTVDSALSVSSNITSGDGSVGSPAHSFVNDPDSGMYSQGANILSFAVAGARGLAISTAGVSVDNDLATGGSIQTASGGAFKVHIYSGSLGSAARVTLTPGGTIVGSSGWTSRGTSPSHSPIDTGAGGGGGTDHIEYEVSMSTATSIVLQNNASGTSTYGITVFYQ